MIDMYIYIYIQFLFILIDRSVDKSIHLPKVQDYVVFFYICNAIIIVNQHNNRASEMFYFS